MYCFTSSGNSVRWSGPSRVERAFHVASLEKLRQVTSSSPAGIWDSSPLSLCFSFLVVYLCQSLAANVVPSFIRRAFNVSVAVSLRLGPPEPHGQVARPRVIDEFVRDEERSALSVYLSRHFLPLCSQAATVQPSQTAQGELSAFDTSYTRSQSTAEGDKPVLGLESGHLAAKNSATVIGRLCA